MRTRTLILVFAVIFACTCATLATPQSTKKRSRASAQSRKSKSKKKIPKKVSSQRIRRIHRAFVASGQLKPMARQLLDDRSRAAYAGVESYARKHARDDAGMLANLALGYAHILDHEPAKAIVPLRNAEAHAGELSDYVVYLLGSAYQATGQTELALTTLRGFDSRFADSIFVRDDAVVYGNALTASGHAAEAVALLQKHRLPTRSDLELALARALLRAGDAPKGTDILRHLYFAMPLAPEADDAGTLLRSTSGGLGGTFALQKVRADAFAQARHYRDAAHEYRELAAMASAEDRPSVEVTLAGALHRAGDDREARDTLEHLAAAGEVNGERFFYLLEIARQQGDEDRVASTLAQLRQAAPNSSWLEQGLLLAGNMFLLRNDYDRAIDAYREIHQRFPQGKIAPYAHWKTAWLNLRQGRAEEARRGFEEQIALYPTSPQVPAAMYWRARLAEEQQDGAKARLYYQKLSQRFRNYYYAELARERLRELKVPVAAVAEPLLDKVPPVQVTGDYRDVEVPDDNLRAQKAELLQNGGLTEFAMRELKMAAEEGGAAWATAEMARLYRDNGQYHRALQLLKRTVPSYFAMDLDDLPRSYWEDLFPRPWWTEVKKYAASNGLDAFVVASLIRQESEFNPGAVSSANALGLMQLLPTTGRKLARELRVRRFSNQQLLVPEVNLQLGTRYFRELVDHFGGRVEYALAAYNAGSDRVEGWLANGRYRDPQEFVESIPFTETREYVQAIMRNTSVYRQLYGNP